MEHIGKTENGKLYHILNLMDGGGHFSLCGCYIPEGKLVEGLNAFELDKEHEICEKCMHIRYYKQDKD